MKNLPLRAKFLFKAIVLFSWLLPRRFKFVAEFYLESGLSNRKSEYEYDSGSIMLGDFTWKGISYIVPVDHDFTEKVARWMRRRSPPTGADIHRGAPDQASAMLGFQCRHLGLIPFNKYSDFHGSPRYLESQYPKFCDVNIMYFPNGGAYLALYVGLNQDATDQVTRVDVSHISDRKYFLSLNPFSKNFGVSVSSIKVMQVEEMLAGRARKIVNETQGALESIFKMWGRSLRPGSYTAVSDFVCHSHGTGYFDKSFSSDVADKAQILFDPRRLEFNMTARLHDNSGVLLEYDPAKTIGVDAIYLKWESRGAENELEYKYLHELDHGIEGFAGLQYLISVEKSLRECAAEISAVFMRADIGSRESLNILVGQSLALNKIDERIDAIKRSGDWFDRAFRDIIRSRVSGLDELSSELRSKIQKRRDQANDEVQLEHLRWTKGNAWLIGALAVSQILIALIAVDWSDTGREKNNIYVNWQYVRALLSD